VSTPNHKIRLLMDLRGAGVTDTRVLAAMERVPREMFVPPTFRDQAYENITLPVGHGQTLSAPTVVATMTQALEVGPRHKVLEIGTGTGYQTSILTHLCRRVYSIERHKPLLEIADGRLKTLQRHNVTTRHGDGWQGWPEQAPFDRILVSAAPSEIPQKLVDQLAEEGVLVAPVGQESRTQRLIRVRRLAGGPVVEDLGPVRFVPMVAGLPSIQAGRR